ncbi:MAG: hypothetical protein RIS35_606 [Pseudomonadota bacterium]
MSIVSLEELVSRIPDGTKLAVPKEDTGVPMAATRALLRRGVRDLHLVSLPVSSLQADLLIGAGCVSTLETSAVSLGEFGTAPRFSAAIREGRIRMIDATCPALYAGFQAGQKGIPFMPLRGILASDVLKHHPDWRVIDNPFVEGDRIVAIKAINPDLAMFHARAADRYGNVFLGRERDGLLMAHASRGALVTVEEIVEGNLLEDPARAGAVLPALYVDAVAVAPKGTWPLPFADLHATDPAFMARYASTARTQDGFAEILAELTSSEAVPA